MKRKTFFILLLFVLSCVAGYVLSKASLVGRVGISLFYKQYRFLKVWWQAGLLVFIVWLLLFFLQGWANKKYVREKAKLIHVGSILVGVVGLYFTYQDFRHTISHRWLGERFHLGGYLFWLGWIMIGVFYLTESKDVVAPTNDNPTENELPTTAGKNVA